MPVYPENYDLGVRYPNSIDPHMATAYQMSSPLDSTALHAASTALAPGIFLHSPLPSQKQPPLSSTDYNNIKEPTGGPSSQHLNLRQMWDISERRSKAMESPCSEKEEKTNETSEEPCVHRLAKIYEDNPRQHQHKPALGIVQCFYLYCETCTINVLADTYRTLGFH